jgi:hypothetical protein
MTTQVSIVICMLFLVFITNLGVLYISIQKKPAYFTLLHDNHKNYVVSEGITSPLNQEGTSLNMSSSQLPLTTQNRVDVDFRSLQQRYKDLEFYSPIIDSELHHIVFCLNQSSTTITLHILITQQIHAYQRRWKYSL